MNEIMTAGLLQGDVNQAADMIKSMLSDKYISPIKKAIEKENKRVRRNPCDETRLLDALKPFMEASGRGAIERTVDLLHLRATLRGLAYGDQKPEIRSQSLKAQDASVHRDGVYDVDRVCAGLEGTNSMMPLILMMILMQKGS